MFLKRFLVKHKSTIHHYYPMLHMFQFMRALSRPSDFPPAVGVLRDIQLANLKILKEIDRICRENKLQYFLNFGTLLGAVRHGGFIPWDDDVDIGMLREDYEKLIRIFDSETKLPLHVQMCSSEGVYICKIVHDSIGELGVDIFPYDYHYKSKFSLEEKRDYVKLLGKLHKEKISCRQFKTIEERLKYLKELYKSDILDGNGIDLQIKPEICLGLDYLPGEKIASFSYEELFPLKEYEFENIKMFIPSNSDLLLTYFYGDYMVFPEEINLKPSHFSCNKVTLEEILAIKEFSR